MPLFVSLRVLESVGISCLVPLDSSVPRLAVLPLRGLESVLSLAPIEHSHFLMKRYCWRQHFQRRSPEFKRTSFIFAIFWATNAFAGNPAWIDVSNRSDPRERNRGLELSLRVIEA